MDEPIPVDERFLSVRRVIAAIAYENNEIDEQERLVLASSMAGQFQFTKGQVQTLLDDAVERPSIESLVSSLTDGPFMLLLLVDLMTLALAKEEWEDSELAAANRAINTIKVPQKAIETIRQAFGLLIEAASEIREQSVVS